MNNEESMDDEAFLMINGSGFVKIGDADIPDFSTRSFRKKMHIEKDSISYDLEKLRSENISLIKDIELLENRVKRLEDAFLSILSNVKQDSNNLNITLKDFAYLSSLIKEGE